MCARQNVATNQLFADYDLYFIAICDAEITEKDYIKERDAVLDGQKSNYGTIVRSSRAIAAAELMLS